MLTISINIKNNVIIKKFNLNYNIFYFYYNKISKFNYDIVK